MILPHMAAFAPERLREILPALLVILARVLCWTDHPSAGSHIIDDDDEERVHEGSDDGQRGISPPRKAPLPAIFLLDYNHSTATAKTREGPIEDPAATTILPDLDWKRLGQSKQIQSDYETKRPYL